MGAKEKLTVLNPRGIPKPLTRTSLAPRLSDLRDKKVYVIPCLYDQSVIEVVALNHSIVEALNEAIPGIKAALPKTAFSRSYLFERSENIQARPTPEEETELKDADAVVNGVSW